MEVERRVVVLGSTMEVERRVVVIFATLSFTDSAKDIKFGQKAAGYFKPFFLDKPKVMEWQNFYIDYLEPKWLLFWLEKTLFWRGQG